MIRFIFTLDYEIYGNGEGRLRELVLNPTRRLTTVFSEFGAPLVVFPEALEFARMEKEAADADITDVSEQLRQLRAAGHEIGLHLHPWWGNASREDGHWRLDWSERNICTLSAERVETLVGEGVSYLRTALRDPDFTPIPFRSGLWAMQPTQTISQVLARHGILVDSSVFKGGRTRALSIDYRPSLRNGTAWLFDSDVNVPTSTGRLLEVPIHTEMVPFWKMLGAKRLRAEKNVPSGAHGTPLRRWPNFLRLRYPRKLDFCRMTFSEMRQAVERTLERAAARPDAPTVIVAIGHSKDFVDADAVQGLLRLLKQRAVAVTTFSRLLDEGLGSSC